MTSKEIRKSFLDFFKSKEHRIVDSAPVVPHGDPTLLFTNAGMNQFKDVFLGSGTRDYSRAADTQKCIRVSGKHNDLEEVGVDTYHHTFFEMLGNWSFGDYYKEEAIDWAWELLTKVWGLDETRLYATVFRTDDEAFDLWKKHLPEDKILRFDEKDNFWEMGETGPCGPCSEIHYDRTEDKSGKSLVNAGVQEVIEIWNLVFIQYNRREDGSLVELSAKHVDTGMGFERICSVIQGVSSNYDTDVFTPIIKKIEELSGSKYVGDLEDPDSIAMRVISDHIRTLSFAIADGAIPGNEGRDYVLRRILRRASRFARNLGMKEPVLYKLLPVLIETMGDFFPELAQQKPTIEKVVKAEEESFLQTLERGLEKFDSIVAGLNGRKTISGADAFLLYDTFGFPLDLTQLIAREKGLEVDTEGFEKYMKQQKERSRAARKVTSVEADAPKIDEKSEFKGYSDLRSKGKVVYAEGNQLVLDCTPFYVESGGQVSDTGRILIDDEEYKVVDLKKAGDAIVHVLDRDVKDSSGAEAVAEVDESRRRDIMRNHSATHLLHEALRLTLGDHVKQAGSLVAPDYLRFDFNHFEKLTEEEIKQIEKIVNEKIRQQINIQTQELAIDEAKENPKIKMFFGDKYGDKVRVVTMDEEYSQELCGGTHVSNTAEIGMFKITSESSIASGVRRIEAVTGRGVEEYIDKLEDDIKNRSNELNDLMNKIRKMEKQLSKQKVEQTAGNVDDMISNAEEVDGIRIVAREIEVDNVDQLRAAADELRNKFGTMGIGLLAISGEGKVQMVCAVTDDLKKQLPAGKLVGDAAKRLGGGGGGKPHMATAGGKDVENLGKVLGEFPEIVKSHLK